MSPEKAAIADFWEHKRFWLLQSLALAVWCALALSWFWLPDSKVWTLLLVAVQGLAVILAAGLLFRWAVRFYGRRPARTILKRTIQRPRFYAGFAALTAIGVGAPYALIAWRPHVSGFAAQTASLAIRFTVAYVIAVSAFLLLASLVAYLGTDSTEVRAQSSSGRLSPRIARPNP